MSSSHLEEFCLQMTETLSDGLNPKKGICCLLGLRSSAGHRHDWSRWEPSSISTLAVLCWRSSQATSPLTVAFSLLSSPGGGTTPSPRSSSESLRTGFHWLGSGQVPVAEPITVARGRGYADGAGLRLCPLLEPGTGSFTQTAWTEIVDPEKKAGEREMDTCLLLGNPGLKGVK